MGLGFHSLNNPSITELTEDRLVLQESTKTGTFFSQLVNIMFAAGFFYFFYFVLKSGQDMFNNFFFIIFIGLFVFNYFRNLFVNSIVVDRKIGKVQFIRAPRMGILGKTREVNFSDIASVELKYVEGGEGSKSYWSTKIRTISSGNFQTFAGDYEPLPRIIAEKISKLTGKPLV
jgi:hypothetical protein